MDGFGSFLSLESLFLSDNSGFACFIAKAAAFASASAATEEEVEAELESGCCWNSCSSRSPPNNCFRFGPEIKLDNAGFAAAKEAATDVTGVGNDIEGNDEGIDVDTFVGDAIDEAGVKFVCLRSCWACSLICSGVGGFSACCFKICLINLVNISEG